MDKLQRHSMSDRFALQSEAAGIDTLLDELQKEHSVKDISGWQTGFANLSRALDGILPGLYFLVGPPGCGKTSFAKQLLDQTAMHNDVPGIYFTFAERRKEIALKTLARLSEIDSRELRRGSAYLLHWYGVPKAHDAEIEQWAPSWEKVIKSAQQAKPWLQLLYVVECGRETGVAQIEDLISAAQANHHGKQALAVIDDSQRLGARDQPMHSRLPLVAERLQETAVKLKVPILAVWPDLREQPASLPQLWCERIPAADVILVLQPETEPANAQAQVNRRTTLHIVANRGGEKGQILFGFIPPFAKFVEG
jgi:replicative DNA helicase